MAKLDLTSQRGDGCENLTYIGEGGGGGAAMMSRGRGAAATALRH